MEASKPERPAHVPEYWKWGTKTDTWSFLIKFVSTWAWTVPGKQGTANLNGVNYTFFVPPRWKKLQEGVDYLFTTSARTDRDTGEITHLIAMPYPPVRASKEEKVSPVFRVVGKLKYSDEKLSGFRVYRNVDSPGLKKKFMVHLAGPSSLPIDATIEAYGIVDEAKLLYRMGQVLDVSPPMNEVQEVKGKQRFNKPKPNHGSKTKRVRVQPKW